ncbi:MAG: ribokinase [Acetobacteraceae bacterium]|nr:ribokinase [Acetobacteraceae bacterium]
MSIAVVGSLHLDLMVEAPGLPRLGETVAGRAWSERPGGKGGNQAIAAARNGATVTMLGLVGADEFGGRLRANLQAEGVDTDGVAVREGATSGISVAISDASGDYAAVIVSGVNLLLDAALIRSQARRLAGRSWLLLQNEVPEAANLAAAQLARAGGARVLLNAAPARALSAELMGLVDILVVNALEAEMLSGRVVSDLAAAQEAASVLAGRVPCAVVTAGEAGLACAGRDGELVLPGLPVAVVSTHGAGDALVGALAARLDAGDSLIHALHYANAAAAMTVQATEAERSLIRADRVSRWLEAR